MSTSTRAFSGEGAPNRPGLGITGARGEMNIPWQRIWRHVTDEFQCDRNSIHGPSHWHRVERNSLLLSSRSGAVVEVVRLFAVFHDSRREHDGWDDTHGAMGAAYAAKLRGVLFDLSDEHFELLHYACKWHTHGRLSEDATIGTCWDADRLDLGRVGLRPEARYMSTSFGRKIATRGSTEAYLRKLEDDSRSAPTANATRRVGL